MSVETWRCRKCGELTNRQHDYENECFTLLRAERDRYRAALEEISTQAGWDGAWASDRADRALASDKKEKL